ncbi:MAG: antitoxin of toxin-antitoxin system Phd [bacterium]|nr:MAG: antitoxin of toxin-antitoxin system Phd [bacterium]
MSEISTNTDVSSAREQFSTLLNRAAFGKERILLTRHGKPVVAVIPVEDLELLEMLEEKLELKAALEAKKEAKEQGTIEWDKIKEDLGL